MFSIVVFHSDAPRIVYLKHHRAKSVGWASNSLCNGYLIQLKQRLHSSCKIDMTDTWTCKVCQWQSPSLRSTASYTVFHFVYNSDKSKLSLPRHTRNMSILLIRDLSLWNRYFQKHSQNAYLTIGLFRIFRNWNSTQNIWLRDTFLSGTVLNLKMTQSPHLWSTNMNGGEPTASNIFSL